MTLKARVRVVVSVSGAMLSALALSGCVLAIERDSPAPIAASVAPQHGTAQARVSTPAPAPAIAAQPPIYVRAVRIGAVNPETTAVFYSKAFGMHEIRRINGEGFVEIILNSGATKEDALANPRAPIVIMTKPKDLQMGVMANVILNVTDMAGTIRAVEEAGGVLFRAPKTAGSGASYAFIKDPEGNQVELLGR